jgi:hypothetical protein
MRALNRKENIEKHTTNDAYAQARSYASPGATVEDDLADQLNQFFKQYPRKTGPENSPYLHPDTTLYGEQ